MKTKILVGALGALLIATSARAQSKLNVVTATEDLASIAREVGGDRITVESIARGYQDPHFVEAKPSFILKLQKADLLVVVGRELEIGWLPPLITQSRNGKIQPGAAGYLDASLGATILEIPTGQVFRGDSGEDLFHSNKPGDLSYVGHLRAYHDITEDSNVDLGFSYSQGHNKAGIVDEVDVGRFKTKLYGFDATFRWRPLQRSIYHSFIGRTELIWSRRDQFDGLQKAMGYYVSGDYQFGRRWFAGLRYDRSDHADDATLFDTGQSAVLTYWPSEFSQVRGQYRRTKYAIGPTANEFLFQFQFSIGAHGAHPF